MNYYENIKDYLIRNEINHKIKDYSKNKGDLETYYNVGKLLVIAQGGEKRAKYGDGLIKEYSKKLTKELDEKYNYRNLFSMRKFYLIFKNEKLNAVRSQLSWTHYRILLSIEDFNEILYYIDLSIKLNLSTRQLENHIKNRDYERLSFNTKLKLVEKKNIDIIETIKEPIIINNTSNIDIYKEEVLKKLILEDYKSFLEELGEGYFLVGDEYRIKIKDRYNYIDILLYNKKYRCYVVVELKIGELKKEHIGQISFYVDYVDKNIKDEYDNKTIGIILCNRNNKLYIDYSTDFRIVSREYIIN